MGKDYNVMGRLSLDGVSVPVTSFQLDFPSGVLGSKLTCDLADLSNAVDESLQAVFELGIGTGVDMEWTTLMDLGKINSLQNSIKWLGDNRKVTAVSGIADKWNLAPEVPILLFNPSVIDPITTGQANLGEIVDEDHHPIFPVLIPKPNLDLQQLLNYVYVDQLGFTRIVTNIPNFNINFVPIPLTSSFYSVAQSEVGLFQPEYYSDDSNVLWIVDPQGVLPSGNTPRKMLLKHYASFDRSRQTGQQVNCVILSYRPNFTTGPITSRVEQEVQEVGTPFSIGWQRTTINRFINDFHDNLANPLEVTRSVVTRVLTQITAEFDGLARLVSTEDQVDKFLYDFRLKTGYTKTLTKYFSALSGDTPSNRLVQVEDNQIVWESLTTPGEYIKRFDITSITGNVIKTYDDPSDPDGSSFRLQSFDQVSKLNSKDLPSSDDSVITENQPITTKIDTFRVVGHDQIEVSSQRLDYLKDPGRGTSDRGDTFQHTGTIQARATTSNAMQINMVIERQPEGNTKRRVPVSLNAGHVPFDVAKSLVNRILDRQGEQPTRVSMELSGLDLALRRGSLRLVHDRDDNQYKVFITGFSISGQNLGQPNFNVTMTAEGLVI